VDNRRNSVAKVSVAGATQEMDVRFCLDPDTGDPHTWAHEVTEDEVLEVLVRPGDDFAGADGSRIALGQTAAGRYLRVIYVPDPDADSILVVTAYDLRGKPLQAYRRRRRTRR
jgi:hypothetical protein